MAYGGYQQPPPPPGGSPPPPPPGGAPPPQGGYGGQPQYEEVPGWWWLLPIFLTWLGGLIAWLVWKDKNPEKAKKMLIVGIVMIFVWMIIPLAIGGAMCLMA